MHRALSKLTFGLQADVDESDEMQAVTMESSMTVIDFSQKDIGAADAMLIAAFLPKCQ